jgi:hypothetical protein
MYLVSDQKLGFRVDLLGLIHEFDTPCSTFITISVTDGLAKENFFTAIRGAVILELITDETTF